MNMSQFHELKELMREIENKSVNSIEGKIQFGQLKAMIALVDAVDELTKAVKNLKRQGGRCGSM